MIISYSLDSKFGKYSISLDQCALVPMLHLIDKARKAGFSPRIISAYRDYERQFKIWNDKLLLKRSVMDFDGNTVLNMTSYTPQEIIKAVARWSAFPGFSRHHWGTDFDIVDETFFDNLAQIQLIPRESDFYSQGPNYYFHDWLKKNMLDLWMMPYVNNDQQNAGVGPEPWHISLIHKSEEYKKIYNKDYWNQMIVKYHSNLGVYSSFIKQMSEQLYFHYQ